MHDRRSFLKQASLLVAGTQAGLLLPFDPVTTRAAAWFQTNNGASASASVAETAYGKVRGTSVEHIKIFKGIPYGGPTDGKNRFMPPTKPSPWTGVRGALAYGPSAPQTNPGARPAQASTSGQGLGKESGAILRRPARGDATKEAEMLLAEVGLKPDHARELQSISVEQLLRGYYAAAGRFKSSIPGTLPHSPTIDGKAVPGHPFDPKA